MPGEWKMKSDPFSVITCAVLAFEFFFIIGHSVFSGSPSDMNVRKFGAHTFYA